MVRRSPPGVHVCRLQPEAPGQAEALGQRDRARTLGPRLVASSPQGPGHRPLAPASAWRLRWAGSGPKARSSERVSRVADLVELVPRVRAQASEVQLRVVLDPTQRDLAPSGTSRRPARRRSCLHRRRPERPPRESGGCPPALRGPVVSQAPGRGPPPCRRPPRSGAPSARSGPPRSAQWPGPPSTAVARLAGPPGCRCPWRLGPSASPPRTR